MKIPVTSMGNSNISFNLRTGLTYKGSLIENDNNASSNEVSTKPLVTYKQEIMYIYCLISKSNTARIGPGLCWA
ncbi:MAG: hypothetical protein IPH56_06590 [Chitinophagaceae bacterium]|nr:hypothetical protein [Chitinophagaceae bacterium]